MKRGRAKNQARTMDHQSSLMLNLPDLILIEIISRLPIKTVMATGCSCKSLLSVISDSYFQMLHSTRAPTELMVHGGGESQRTLSIIDSHFLDDSYFTDVDAKSRVVFELPNISVAPTNSYCYIAAAEERFSFVNSCNGLVCFRGPARNMFAVVCNPFTGEYIKFPRFVRSHIAYHTCYGLGFSSKDNCYKLLRMYSENGICNVEICTIGERGSSWRSVADCPGVSMECLELAAFHEGAIHWYYRSRDDTIVSFDFDTELFGKLVALPRMRDICSFKIRPSLVSLEVLVGGRVEVHSGKSWYCKNAAKFSRACTSSWAVKDVIKADKSSAPSSSSEALASAEEKAKEDVLEEIGTLKAEDEQKIVHS